MKRPLLLLALPLILAALMFGVKWRVAKPLHTKEELQTRAFLAKSSSVSIHYFSRPDKAPRSTLSTTLSKAEFAPFLSSLYLTTIEPRASICLPQKGVLSIECQLPPDNRYPLRKSKVWLNIAVGEGQGYADISSFVPTGGELDPGTVQRWLELVAANPRIGTHFQALVNSQ